MKARFYDPDVGRFMNQDTYLGEHGTPPSLHRYLYAYSNPTVYVDADGHVAGLDETGQYLMDTGKELLNHVDEDSSWYETAFFGITAGANYFVGGVVETVNFGLNIVGNEGVLGSRVQERAQSELDEAFGTIQFISENKTQVAQNLFSSARTTLSEAASGNSKAQAELVAFATGMVGLKGQNSLLSANRTAAVVNAAKTVSSAVKGSKVAVSATKTIERAVVAGGNRATQLANSAATGVKKAAVKVANAAKSGRLNPLNYKPEYGTLGMNGSKMKFVPPKKP
ncbi:hypothetical protein TDB9533_04763 [Thalassocella blandensis]|nr:hypothetical protein TDB9533_04763 [Thalassocella blandensis]